MKPMRTALISIVALLLAPLAGVAHATGSGSGTGGVPDRLPPVDHR